MLNKEKINANKTTKFGCRGGRLCPPANKQNGITLIALIITMIAHCDNTKKIRNINSFLLSSI